MYIPAIGEGNGNPLLYSFLENSMDRGAWWAAVHRVAQGWTQLKRLSRHACTGEGNGHPLQYSAWRIPGTEEPGGLLSVGLNRVRHDWSTLAAAAYSYYDFINCFGFVCVGLVCVCVCVYVCFPPREVPLVFVVDYLFLSFCSHIPIMILLIVLGLFV